MGDLKYNINLFIETECMRSPKEEILSPILYEAFKKFYKFDIYSSTPNPILIESGSISRLIDCTRNFCQHKTVDALIFDNLTNLYLAIGENGIIYADTFSSLNGINNI